VGKRKIRLFHLLIKEYQIGGAYLVVESRFIFEARPKWEWKNALKFARFGFNAENAEEQRLQRVQERASEFDPWEWVR
jgi:hypothetical protein